MHSCPFRHHSDCLWGQVTFQNTEIIDSYYRIVFIVDYVKMGWAMISKVHLDDYAVEAAHGRHRSRIRAYRILVNPALVRLAALVVTPTATSCQGEMHACGSPMHNDLDPYNIELSCAAESDPENHIRLSPFETGEALGDSSNDLL